MSSNMVGDEDKEVATTINQSFLHGKVQVKQVSGILTLEQGQHQLSDVPWVLHDNWGYYFPGKAAIELTNRSQHGDWNKVLKRMPVKDMQADLFTLWFNHHNKPADARYVYYVFPAARPDNLDSRASAFEIKANSATLQVVENVTTQLVGCVFAEPGELVTNTCNKVSADKPCVLMITKKGTICNMAISDPTQKLASLNIGVSGRKNTKTGTVTYDKSRNMTFIHIPLPQ